MLDYDKLKPGDEVEVDLDQTQGCLFAGVVVEPVTWKSKKKAVGFILVRVAHHADVPGRRLVVHSRYGANRHYDELHPVGTKAKGGVPRLRPYPKGD